MPQWIENLQRLVELVEAKLAEARAEEGPYDIRDYSAWRARSDAATAKLVEFFQHHEDARFGLTGAHDHWVRMCGIKSTSTGGLFGALQNWRTAALKKIEKATA